MRSSSGQGSIIGFVLVGLLLVAVAGTLFYVGRHQGDSVVPEVEIIAPSDRQDDETASSNDAPKDEEAVDVPPVGAGQDSVDERVDQDVAELSQTGPAETAMTMIGVGALAGAGVAYIQSRRQLRR